MRDEREEKDRLLKEKLEMHHRHQEEMRRRYSQLPFDMR